MLDNIRKTADSFVMRVLFAMIAFAFVGWGIKDILPKASGGDFVTFTHAKNISREDFLKAKSTEINAIQKQMGTNLSEEEINQLNIDKQIMRKLIYNNILDYLVTYYDFDLSDNTVTSLVKESPAFKNDQGVFDIRIFKTYFRNSYINEEEYLLNFKEKTLKNILVSSFLESFYVPKIMIQNIINHMAEKRNVELLQINLKNKPKDLKIPVPNKQQLEDFYKNNKNLFEIPEKRSFSYIKISNQNLQKKINITKEELLSFYNENKEEFGDQAFEKVEKQLYDLLLSQKIDVLNMELAKNLEDDVAAGSTLVEIAEKYELPLQNVNYVSYEELIENKIIAENVDSIFELVEGELSYPIESEDKSYLILVELKAIQPAKTPEFSAIKDQVATALAKQYLADINLQTIKDLAKEYKAEKENIKNLNLQGIEVSQQSYIRSEIENDIKLSPEILLSIFRTKVDNNTPVFQIGNKVYFAYVKSIILDKNVAENIAKNSSEHIANTIKNSLIDELINYAIKQNNMKIKSR
ncbi:SurA N-terminal domain-containing protein [Rickettsia endosymbiont of Halotydeus destructor]|uniref:SurA N-terminal domain-containing protein n=1 Tax=Rickettsia endosymbiont of Halotydeus destructor TaxID=2996754 RepID=UPI003BAF99B7